MEVKVFETVLHGADIVSTEVDSYECENYRSILEHDNKIKMDAIIADELENGILTSAENKPTCVHSLGAVDKPDGGIRPIKDCSRPEGASVNSHVEGLPISVKYKSVDNMVGLLNQHDFMGVIDIKSAYRSVSINPEHVTFQGLKWEFEDGVKYLVDHRLCFGLKCGPHYFSLISDFIQEKLVKMYGIRVVNYLDDYITLSDSEEGCGANQLCVIRMFSYLGFQISWRKVSPPSQVTKYLGIEIDSVNLELRLPMYCGKGGGGRTCSTTWKRLRKKQEVVMFVCQSRRERICNGGKSFLRNSMRNPPSKNNVFTLNRCLMRRC